VKPGVKPEKPESALKELNIKSTELALLSPFRA